MKLKKGDQVIVRSGAYKRKKAKIERLFLKQGKVLLPGINIKKKHLKRKDEKNPGGIIEVAKPLPVSKVALICPRCHQPARVGYKIKGQKKQRICKKCQEVIDQ